MSPATTSSRSFRNISRSVAVVLRVSLMPDDLDLLHLLEAALLDPARDDRAAPGDREHVLDRHQEGLVGVAGGLGDVGVAGVEQLVDLGPWRLVALEGLEAETWITGTSSPGNS